MLSFDAAGAGSPVLLLHSSVCDARMWDPVWAPLTGAHRAIRCDFPGSGRTPLPAGTFCVADDVRDLLDSLDLDRVSLVGSSYGGRIALEVASTWPERVERLALLCAATDAPPSPEFEALDEEETALLEAGDVDGAVELNVRTWLGPEASEQTRAAVRAMQRQSFEMWLAADPEPEHRHRDIALDRITAPALVVSGAHDLPDFREGAAHLIAALPSARGVELPWAGHLPSLERPDEVAALLLDFLAERPSAR